MMYKCVRRNGLRYFLVYENAGGKELLFGPHNSEKEAKEFDKLFAHTDFDELERMLQDKDRLPSLLRDQAC